MKIEIAKHSGYCFGVNRAMEIASQQLESSDGTIYAIGPIIHNDQAMQPLTDRGLIVEEDITKIKKNSSAIIRSHGLAKQFYDTMKRNEIRIVDATCPFVKKIQNIVFESSEKGYDVIVIGDKNHPEVIGIVGWVMGNHHVIGNIEEANEFIGTDSKHIVVVQTTFKLDSFEKIKEILSNKLSDIIFYNTICYATKERQESAVDLAKRVDAMIVVGGKKSSNTKKLAELCSVHCPTFLVETIEDLDLKNIEGYDSIGLVAGASTPEYIVNQIVDAVNKI